MAKQLGFVLLLAVALSSCSLVPPLQTSLDRGPHIPSGEEGTPRRIRTRTVAPDATPIRLIWPIQDFRISRGFKSGRKKHWGIDLAAPKGTPIRAAHEGLVIYAGRDFKGFGRLVMIENGSWASFYSHCSKILVKEGEWVKQGEVIALVGSSGRSTGPHLHFELRKDRIPMDALGYLPSN